MGDMMTTFPEDALNDEQRAREVALYAAYRMTIGDEGFDACDVIDFAEYIRAGVRGLPVTEQPRQPTLYTNGQTFTRTWLDEITFGDRS